MSLIQEVVEEEEEEVEVETDEGQDHSAVVIYACTYTHINNMQLMQHKFNSTLVDLSCQADEHAF